MGWLEENWLGLATLIAALVGAVASVRLFMLARRDVTIRVAFVPGEGEVPKRFAVKEARAEDSVALDLVAFNLGGTTSEPGIVTLTLDPRLEAMESVLWENDAPNALMPEGSTAWSCRLGPIHKNQQVELPTIQLVPMDFEAGPDVSYRIRWEVWIDDEGAGSDDFQLIVRQLRD